MQRATAPLASDEPAPSVTSRRTTFASLFSLAARVGVYPRLNAALLAALVLVTSGLGLGHFTRVIW